LAYTLEHFNRLIREGKGILCNKTKNHQFIFVRSPIYVATKLVKQAKDQNPLLVATNPPGVRDVYLSPAGTHEQWESTLYNGWFTHREAPTIARSTLEKLFNRDEDTLRRWEQNRLTDSLTIRTNYAQYALSPGEWYEYIPDHARAYLANIHSSSGVSQIVRIRFRLPNTYQPKNIRQHPRRGQARKVRKAVNSVLGEPACNRRGGSLTSKRYFDKPEGLRRRIKKQGGYGYLWLGENRHGQGIFELVDTAFAETLPNERAAFKQEYKFFKCLEVQREEYARKSNS
jgi:hypothetical protein